MILNFAMIERSSSVLRSSHCSETSITVPETEDYDGIQSAESAFSQLTRAPIDDGTTDFDRQPFLWPF